MAQYIEMKQLPGNTVTAKDDRILYDVNLKSGIIRGCEISYTGNNMIHINAGYGIIKGGLFEMEDHTEYVEYAEESTALGQIYLHFDPAAEDKLIIICETASSLTPLEQNEDANFTDGIYEMQMCTYTATTTALQDVVQTFPAAEGSVDVLDSLIEIAANTSPGKAAGALAVKSLNSNLTANSLPFRFGYDAATQKYGYILPDGEGGADTVHPFKSNSEVIYIGKTSYEGVLVVNGGFKSYLAIALGISISQSSISSYAVVRESGRTGIIIEAIKYIGTSVTTSSTNYVGMRTYLITAPSESTEFAVTGMYGTTLIELYGLK